MFFFLSLNSTWAFNQVHLESLGSSRTLEILEKGLRIQLGPGSSYRWTYNPYLGGGFKSFYPYLGKPSILKVPNLGGGNSNICSFSPLFGEDFQFDSYFSKGLKPPTRWPFVDGFPCGSRIPTYEGSFFQHL